MKWKVLFGALCIILIGSTAYAEEGTYIVQFNNKIQVFETDSGERHESRNYITATYEELQEYLDIGIVEYYEPNYEVELLETFSTNERNSTQWNLEAINVSKAWNIGCYGNDVVVGVIDSGCYYHTDLESNLLLGRNYTSADTSDTDDNIGHGTFVSGIIAAESNGIYIDGIANKAKIVPLKCFDEGVVTQTSMISDAIYDAIDLYDCDVINLSLQIPKSKITKTLENAIIYAIKNGCIIVAAVGNDGASTEYYPAKYDNVIGVGSVDKNGNVSYFSQYNSTVDFVAPGEAISSVSIDGYSKDSGTSFSTPHVTALAAIAKCINKDITSVEFTDILKTTSHNPEDSGNEKKYDIYYGYGLVDAERMIDELLKETPTFLSPLAIVDNKLQAVLYNNSEEDLDATRIIAFYSILDNALKDTSIIDISLSPRETKKIDIELNQYKTKLMIWSCLDELIPLTPCREYN